MQKILNIPIYGQRDSRWRYQRLGTVNATTIGSDGCVISCHAMSLTARGKSFTPATLDDFLTDNNLYYQGNLWVPANTVRIFSSYKFVSIAYCTDVPAPIARIKTAIDNGQPPTLWVWNNGVYHNILAVGYENNAIIVNDPWEGDQVFINERWGDDATAIQEVDFYEGPAISFINSGGTTMNCLINNDENGKQTFEGLVFKSSQHDETCRYFDFTDPRNTTSRQITDKVDKMINAYKGQVSQALTGEQEAKSKLAVALNEIDNRKEQVGRLEGQLTAEVKLRSELSDKLNISESKLKEISGIYDSRLSALQEQVEAYAKDKGTISNQLADEQAKNESLENQLDICQKGGTVPSQSLWDFLIGLLKGTRVVK